MNANLAIEILKQATIETTVGACEKCPRKDKNKTCIGCLDDAKEKVLDNLQQKENIIKEVREYIETKEKDDDNWVDYELLIEPIRIKEILDKENK